MAKADLTVFVLGAGASSEVGLPIGSELTTRIAAACAFNIESKQFQEGGDPELVSAIQHVADADFDRLSLLVHAGWRIQEAMPQSLSIDNFIDAHAHDADIATCGKLAIACAILRAESRSNLVADEFDPWNKFRFDPVKHTYFNKLFMKIAEGCSLANLPGRLDQVAFVIFNYDRCLEHFLFWSFRNYYGADERHAKRLLQSVKIFHPYGVVGNHPAYERENTVPYGSLPTGIVLKSILPLVRTFTEGTDETSSDIIEIRKLMVSADRVVFLGFAFHPLNVKLLLPGNLDFPSVRRRDTFGTAFEMAESDRLIVENELANRFGGPGGRIDLPDLKCAQLFDRYSRSLGFS